MRISDWSSDVCSSDLRVLLDQLANYLVLNRGCERIEFFGENGLDCFGLRSEEHTSELQSLMRISYAVFCLKKKKKKHYKQMQAVYNVIKNLLEYLSRKLNITSSTTSITYKSST